MYIFFFINARNAKHALHWCQQITSCNDIVKYRIERSRHRNYSPERDMKCCEPWIEFGCDTFDALVKWESRDQSFLKFIRTKTTVVCYQRLRSRGRMLTDVREPSIINKLYDFIYSALYRVDSLSWWYLLNHIFPSNELSATVYSRCFISLKIISYRENKIHLSYIFYFNCTHYELSSSFPLVAFALRLNTAAAVLLLLNVAKDNFKCQ